ncbi:MAG TPA: acyloxyacyl hydrolase [Terriglobales bacterium]
MRLFPERNKAAFLCFLALALIFSAVCAAQSKPSSGVFTRAERGGGNEFTVWGGYSPNSPKLIGVTEDRHVTMLGFGYARVMLANEVVAWKFTIDTVPLILVSQPTLGGTEIAQPSRVPAQFRSVLSRRTTYGIGLMPVGFQFNFRPRKRIQPFAAINGGFGFFAARDVPVPASANFNFMFSAGPGVQIFTSESRSITFGYRFHHISNADTGNPFNPGIDSNFFYAGYSFHR